MIKHLLLFGIVFSTITDVAHATTFSKNELKTMIVKKKYPKVKNPREESTAIASTYCSASVSDAINEAEEDGYPTQIITRKKNLLVAKIWRGNMMTMYTCKGDENLKTTDYDYSF